MHRLLELLTASQHFFQDLGALGVLAFGLLMMLLQVALVPLMPFGLAAGVFFGFWGGLASITLGTGAGAALNFIIARHFARAALTRRLGQSEKFRLIDAAIGQEGWKIVALLRFCPMPFGLANYCYGLTAIPFWPYLLATVVAITPANILFAWMGASAHEGLATLLGSGRPRQPAEYVLLGVGLLTGLIALTIIGRIARGAVAKAHAASLVPADN